MNLETYSPYIPRALELTLILILAWILAGYITRPLEPGIPSSTHLSSQADSAPHTQTARHLLLDTPIFGKPAPIASKAAKPETTPVKQAPVTVSRLNITLLGTVIAGERSAAIVMLGGKGKQQVFFLHDTIQPGVSLSKVEQNAIVVDNHGKSERIEMKKGKVLPGAYQAPISTPAPSITPPTYRTRQMIRRSHLNRQIRDFPRLLSQARVIPHFNQGKPDGFTITDIVPGSLYQQVGLQNGDVILKVNGQTITTAEQGMQMYQTLQHASSIDLEVRRNGSVLPMHYDIQ